MHGKRQIIKVVNAWIAAATLLASVHALAQPAAVVEGVQMPAWLERDGQRVPLVPGMELKAGDRILTGAGSRLAVKLAEGSLVKLGENGTLRFTELQPGQELFKAVLNVLQGAFRFTTDVAAKPHRREVSIGVGQVTAGIRGTDFWGRSRAERQIVCLIEGMIEVGAGGEQPVTLDKPLQFYVRDRGRTQPLSFVEPKQMTEWSMETEIEAGKGAARRGGRWSVTLAAADNQSDALAVYDRLRAAGYPAEILPTKEGDQLTYFVRIRQLGSRAEAQALAERLRGQHGVTEPQVSPQ